MDPRVATSILEFPTDSRSSLFSGSIRILVDARCGTVSIQGARTVEVDTPFRAVGRDGKPDDAITVSVRSVPDTVTATLVRRSGPWWRDQWCPSDDYGPKLQAVAVHNPPAGEEAGIYVFAGIRMPAKHLEEIGFMPFAAAVPV